MSWAPWRKSRCPHTEIIGIYGDEITMAGGYRLRCAKCRKRLYGPVSLATHGIDQFGTFPLEQPQGAHRD